MLEKIAFSAALATLTAASLSDLKTREVPDWLSYTTIVFGFGLRLLYSITLMSWDPIIMGLLGFLGALAVSLVMFYAGQWGGGDSKILMGIGVLLGLEPTLDKIPLLAIFFINSIVTGAAYGLLYSFALAFRHRKQFFSQYHKLYVSNRNNKILAIASSLVMMFAAIIVNDQITSILFLTASIMTILLFFLFIFVKAVENAIMVKFIPVEKLTEGDWIVDEVKIDGKYICGPKDLGIEKPQIQKLLKLRQKGKITKIKIKEGIPFVPAFLLALLLTIIFGNWLMLLL